MATEELLDNPEELAIFLPVLQEVLLPTGQYARTIPILERACQAENAPPSLWIDLAMLYEKLEQRDEGPESAGEPRPAAPISRPTPRLPTCGC